MKGVYERVKGSGDYWIRYADTTGKIRREKAGTKSNAKALYRLKKARVLEGRKLPELRKASVTFAQIAQDALEYSKGHKSSAQDDVERMKLLLEWFGDAPAESLKPQQIQRKLLATQHERNWANATVNRYKALLSLVYRVACDNEKVTVNPVRLVRRLREDNQVVRYLLFQEEANLKAAIEERHPERWAQIVFAVNTGIRASEQQRMRWSDINFERQQVFVNKSKNGASRYIPLNALSLEALSTLRQHCDGDRIFSRQHYRMWFDIALKTAGIADFHWHCLRHTFASRLVMSGADIRTVAELMGHRDLKMTMRYSHLAPEFKAAAVAKLEGFGSPTDTITDTGASTKVVSILQRVANA